MIGFFIQRLLQAVLVVVAMSMLVFVGVYAIGNPIDVMIDPASSQALRESLQSFAGHKGGGVGGHGVGWPPAVRFCVRSQKSL